MDLVALKAEIVNDPQALGYAGKTDEQIAELLNRGNRTIPVDEISIPNLVAALDTTEYAALSAASKTYLNLLLTQSSIPNVQPVRGNLQTLFPAGSATRTKFIALQSRTDGSRAKELGLGPVTPSDVADARRL